MGAILVFLAAAVAPLDDDDDAADAAFLPFLLLLALEMAGVSAVADASLLSRVLLGLCLLDVAAAEEPAPPSTSPASSSIASSSCMMASSSSRWDKERSLRFLVMYVMVVVVSLAPTWNLKLVFRRRPRLCCNCVRFQE